LSDDRIHSLEERLSSLSVHDPLWAMTARELLHALVLRWSERDMRGDMDRVADLLGDLPVSGFTGSQWVPSLALATLVMEARWGLTDIRADLDAAAALALRASQLGGSDEKQRVALADKVARLFARRFEAYGDVPDLDVAIDASRELLLRETAGDRVLWVRNNLAALLHHRWLALDAEQDVVEATELATYVVSATPAGDEHLPTRLANLAVYLDSLNGVRPNSEYRRHAIECGRRAAELLPADSPERVQVLTAQAKRMDYSGAAAEADLDEGVALTSEAIALAGPLAEPKTHLTRAVAMHARYRLHLDRADLDEWITSARRAAAGWPSGEPGREVVLALLAEGQLEMWHVGEDRDDLDLAVTVYGQAVTAYDQSASTDNGFLVSTLGAAARSQVRRFERFGAANDLDAAISFFERAVSALEPGSDRRVHQARGLIDALNERLALRDDKRDIDRSLELISECRAARGPGDPDAAVMALGHALTARARYEQFGGAAADITIAAAAVDDAVALTRRGSPEHARRCGHAADIHVERWRATRNIDELTVAADMARQAARLTPDPEARERAENALRSITGLRDAALDTYANRDTWRRKKRRRRPTTPAAIAAERIEELTRGGPLPPGGVAELLGTVPVFDTYDELLDSAIGWRVVRISGGGSSDPNETGSVRDQTGISRHRYAPTGPVIARLRHR
jgi:hypothetical protein